MKNTEIAIWFVLLCVFAGCRGGGATDPVGAKVATLAVKTAVSETPVVEPVDRPKSPSALYAETAARLASIRSLIDKKKFDSAEDCLDKILAAQPDCAEAYFLKGQICRATGILPLAAEYYTRAIIEDSSRPEYYLARARVNIDRLLAAQVLSDAETALEINPELAEAWYVKGRALLALLKSEEAMAVFEMAERLGYDTKELAVDQIEQMLGQENYTGARARIEVLIEKHKDEPKLHLFRAKCLLRERDPAGALQSVNEAIRLGPNLIEPYTLRATIMTGMGEYEKALADLDHLIERKKIRNFTTLAARGECHQLLGRKKECLADLDEMVRILPSYGEAYARRGQALYMFGEFERAVADFDKTFEFENPAIASWIHNARGRALIGLGQYEKAAEDLKRYVNTGLDDDNYATLFLYVALMRAGETKKAEREIELATRRIGEDEWSGHIVMVFADRMKPEECLKKARTADVRQTRERQCEAYYYLGAWYEARGEVAQAVEYYKKCLENDIAYFVEPPLARVGLARLTGEGRGE